MKRGYKIPLNRDQSIIALMVLLLLISIGANVYNFLVARESFNQVEVYQKQIEEMQAKQAKDREEMNRFITALVNKTIQTFPRCSDRGLQEAWRGSVPCEENPLVNRTPDTDPGHAREETLIPNQQP